MHCSKIPLQFLYEPISTSSTNQHFKSNATHNDIKIETSLTKQNEKCYPMNFDEKRKHEEHQKLYQIIFFQYIIQLGIA